MKLSDGSNIQSSPFAEQRVEEMCKECFSSESDRVTEIGEKFIEYFVKNASSDGVLFKTIKEITQDINIPHQSLSKVLKVLEDKKVIYRRNGIIGLWKE
ncbi:MarR family transcriptional regulator [Planococcus sp. CAU13]|uniref:MarR family transcriptional regulator n=1 Tax=Planococcus sp. CAU13 TaxID=1541197 RepID=UPI00052FFA1A|nr:helix-turn-helix domain-containing protein [Planococcus sp. CAU13]